MSNLKKSTRLSRAVARVRGVALDTADVASKVGQTGAYTAGLVVGAVGKASPVKVSFKRPVFK